ncbi:MAG: hypothetical protein ABR936_16975 [Bacteroidota bacterium]|jgi:hypothetical protein
MGLISRFRHWQASRKEKRIEQLTAKAVDLSEDQEYDLIFLYVKGFVRAMATGQSITEIYAEVENLIRKKLHVIVKPGTYFVSSGNHQNMVTRRDYSFTLFPCSSKRLNIDAACINASLAVPGKNDRFYGVRRVSDKLSKFLEASKNSDPMVVQAGVWALTDGYTANQVKTHLVARDQYGHTRQAVSDSHIEEARRILNNLSIHNNL